jgi:hypothetical protein
MITSEESMAYVAEVAADYELDLEITGVLFEQYSEYVKDEPELTFEEFIKDEFTAAAWMSCAASGGGIQECTEAAEQVLEAFE